MKVNYFEHNNTDVGSFILKLLETNLDRTAKMDGKNLDIKLTIDGTEFDFVKVVESMTDKYDRDVSELASHRMKSHFKNEVFDKLYEISNQASILEDQINDKIQDIWNK